MLFWVDEERNVIKSDKGLIDDIKQRKYGRYVISEENPYEMLVDLLVNMLNGFEFILLDADLSKDESSNIGITEEMSERRLSIKHPIQLSSFDQLINAIKCDWKVWLFTSGTTGLPKRVGHTYKSLLRNVRYGDKYLDNVWAMAYNISHMAGLQVFFQALLNHNSLIYIFESRPDAAYRLIDKYSCTNISATPTFYRNLLPYIRESTLSNMCHLTLGGERFDSDLVSKLQKVLPHVHIHNIYASTEGGSIFASHGNSFKISEGIEDKVRISPDGELLINKCLLGDFVVDGDWYHTHDLVEQIGDEIRFISRKSELINVGGYKVNPIEIESAIEKVDGVVDSIVQGRKNSVMGNLLVADIVLCKETDSNDMKRRILNSLRENLQEYKIPRIIKFVTEIPRTKTGKKVRICN